MNINEGVPIELLDGPPQFKLELIFGRNVEWTFSDDILRRYISKRFPSFLINNSNIKLFLLKEGVPSGQATIASSDDKAVNLVECELSCNDIFFHIGSLLETNPTLGEEYKKAIIDSTRPTLIEKRNEVVGKALRSSFRFSDQEEFLRILENDFLDPKSYSTLLHELTHTQLLRIYADPSELERLLTRSEIDSMEDKINSIISQMDNMGTFYSIDDITLRSKTFWVFIIKKLYSDESSRKGFFISKYLEGVQEIWVRLVEILSQIEMSKPESRGNLANTVDKNKEGYRYKNYEFMRKPYTPGGLYSSMEGYWRICILPPTELLDKLKQMDSYSVQSDLFNREKVINFMRTELLPLMDRERVEQEWKSFKEEFLDDKKD